MLARVLLALVFLVLASTHALAQNNNWPQHLGPARNGISTEKGLLEAWPVGGPKEVWRVKGGVGMSGLAISGGRLYTLAQREGQQGVVAHDAATGAAIWRTAVAPAYENQMGDGPRATPTVAGNTVFAFTGEGILVALSAPDGRILWSHNTVKELGGQPAEYGMACSPLVVGTQVIVTVGAPNATVVAYDTVSGKLTWTTGNETTGYSSPALLTVGGREQIVVHSGSAVLGIEPNSGALLWVHPYVTDYSCNIATPIAVEGKVFVSSGENHGCALLALEPSGNLFTVREVWSSQGPRSVLRNEWQTSILLEGHLYGMDNVGGAGPITHLTCVNAATGESVWQESRFGKGNLIAADGKLFMSTLKGELIIARVSPNGYEELGRSTVIGSTRQAPALANGLLYLRDNDDIACFDVHK
ncbi:MAG TPA: PQQ-binding-like beta-propeller repeat protein [Pirellulaceae bacterium]|nr:PQQ-binding-like beta-propeller repeat protein [Planctomycetales bacterium]HRX81612.1 PQQ-binding-like beta-propeller repeat protein [Pirellulaceae bacterium]